MTAARALGVAVLTLLLAVPCHACGRPGGGPAGGGGHAPAALRLTSISPDVATAGGVLRVTGEITNTGRQALRDVEVRLRLSATRLGSRAELAAVAEGRTTSRDGEPIVSTTLPDLDAGETTTFAVSASLDELPQLTGFGVYVLGVEVLAGRPAGFGRVALVRTLLPWVPEQPDFLPTGFTWLWPLVSRPTRLSNGTFADDVLAGEMAADGRLSRLLDAGAGSRTRRRSPGWSTPSCWRPPPTWPTATGCRHPTGRRCRAAAPASPGSGWTGSGTVTAGKPVLALPYADPDLVALNRHGRAATSCGPTRPPRPRSPTPCPWPPPVTDIAWPVDGFVNRGTLGVLRGGCTAAVLDGRAVPPEIDLSYTPAGRADLAPSPEGGRACSPTPAWPTWCAGAAPTPLLAGQRFLAETAMITSELPAPAPSARSWSCRRAGGTRTQAFLDRLVATADAPWTPRCRCGRWPSRPARRSTGSRCDYPSGQRRRELRRAVPARADAMHSGISLLGGDPHRPRPS